MKSCFPSGLKCRHGSVKIPNFWCQVSHRLQINHPQHSVEATVSLSVSNSSCCALSLSNGGGLIIHISVLTGGTEDTGLQQPPALSLYKCLFALSVLLECPFKHFYSTALTSLKKKKENERKFTQIDMQPNQEATEIIIFFFLKLIYAWPIQTCLGRNRFWMHL